MIVGLTGQSGAGKTTAAAELKKAGFMVLNCDEIAHEMIESDPCAQELFDCFGENIKSSDGRLLRKELSKIVFSSESALKKLNAITHPYILNEIKRKIKVFNNEQVIVLDAPTLFESGADALCDIILSVICDHDLIIKRLELRDGIDEAAAERRLKSQKSEDFFRKHSDIIIENTSELSDMVKSVSLAISKIKLYIK